MVGQGPAMILLVISLTPRGMFGSGMYEGTESLFGGQLWKDGRGPCNIFRGDHRKNFV